MGQGGHTTEIGNRRDRDKGDPKVSKCPGISVSQRMTRDDQRPCIARQGICTHVHDPAPKAETIKEGQGIQPVESKSHRGQRSFALKRACHPQTILALSSIVLY